MIKQTAKKGVYGIKSETWQRVTLLDLSWAHTHWATQTLCSKMTAKALLVLIWGYR